MSGLTRIRNGIVSVIFLCIMVSSCATSKFTRTGPDFPPFEGPVKVLFKEPKSNAFEEIGVISSTGGMLHEWTSLISAIQKKAAKHGANAIIIQGSKESDNYIYSYNQQLGLASSSNYPVKTMLARAIKLDDKQKPDKNPPENDKGIVRQNRPMGTGFFITSSGIFITASHVIEESKNLSIKTDSAIFPAKVLLNDKANDLAVLKATGRFAYLPLSLDRSVATAENIFTVGFPNVSIQGFEPKFSGGEVSSTRGFNDDPRYIQISCPVQPGNSGGPLVSEKDYRVVGIVVSQLNSLFALKQTGSIPQNVNYAIKISYLLPLLNDLPVNDLSTLSSVDASIGVNRETAVKNVKNAIGLVVAN